MDMATSDFQVLSNLERASCEMLQPLEVDLHNDVHPFWQRTRFRSCVNYVVFLQAARLAMCFLQSPAAIYSCHAILFGTREEVEPTETTNESCTPRRRIRGKYASVDEVDDKAKRQVERNLRRISDRVTHQMGEWEGNALARTHRSNEYKRGAVIRYSTKYIDSLFSNDLDASGKAAQPVYLAVVLIHEFGHALEVWANWREDDLEDFFEDSTFAEMGHEFVARIFGGSPGLSRARNGRAEFLQISEWPGLWTTEGYDWGTMDFICCCLCIWPHPLSWTVQRGFINNILRDSFWDEDVAS